MNQARINSNLRWGCRDDTLTSQYTWRVILLLSVAVSGIILAVQFPVLIYSPDGSFHAAKILRASKGEFFIDPFTGISTIYPSLFHFCFGLLKRALDFNSVQIIQLIVLVDFIGLFAAFYYLAAPFFNNAMKASLCVLSLPLVFNAPTGHYILLPQPSSFSFVFLIFGIGALYRYAMNQTPIHLVSGGLLLSAAVNIWWSNVFSVLPVLVVLTYYTITHGLIPKPSYVVFFILALLIPCFYTAWQFYILWDILPNYLAGTSKHVNFLDILATWITTFLTKGNLQFIHHFNFWDLSKAPSSTSHFLSDGVKLLYSLTSSFHYFLVVLPFNLLLVAYVCWMLLRKDQFIAPGFSLVRTLAIGGFFILLFSIVMRFGLDIPHLRRVQFIIYVMFLLFAYKTMPLVVPIRKLQKLSVYICIASLFSLIYTVVYSPSLFTSELPDSDTEIVRFVGSIPDHDNERIFMSDEGRRRIAPFVTFQSFVEKNKGLYYWQDPITASKVYGDFMSIKEKNMHWRNVVRERRIKWLLFKTSDPTELAVLRKYENHGSVRFKNADWIALEVSL